MSTSAARTTEDTLVAQEEDRASCNHSLTVSSTMGHGGEGPASAAAPLGPIADGRFECALPSRRCTWLEDPNALMEALEQRFLPQLGEAEATVGGTRNALACLLVHCVRLALAGQDFYAWLQSMRIACFMRKVLRAAFLACLQTLTDQDAESDDPDPDVA